MSDDLLDPGVVSAEAGDIEERQWRVLRVMNALLAGYAVIHKVLVPLMKLAPQTIDPWFVFHPILWLPLKSRRTNISARLAFFGAGFALFRILSLRAPTWQSLSTVMTEGFTFFFLMYLLRSPVIGVRRAQAAQFALGILGLACAYGVSRIPELKWNQPHQAALTASHQSDGHLEAAHDSTACGAEEVQVTKELLETTAPSSNLEVTSCGFHRSLVVVKPPLLLKNRLDRFLNFRAEKWTGSDWRFVRNVPLFSGQAFTFSASDFETGNLYRMTSDTWPEAGVSAIYVPGTMKTQLPEWVSARNKSK